jgi:hypothetical protein
MAVSKSREYPHTLNLVFHGLWAYEVSDKGILVRTPPMADHQVRAGSWNPEYSIRGGRFSLDGVQDGGAFRFDPEVNVILQGRRFDDTAPVDCAIELPPPAGIRSLRPIVFHPDKPPYTGADAGLVSTRKIAIVQVFTYAANLSSARLVGEGFDPIRPVVEQGESVANLYLFAQPASRTNPSHFEEAFAGLARMFGLDLVPVPSVAPGPVGPKPPLPGIGWRDLVGLNERAAFNEELVPAGGTSGSSCDPFVIDNWRLGTVQSGPRAG